MKLLLVVAVVMVGCGAAHKPGCADVDLAAINAREQGEIALHCHGQGVECSKREEIHAEYKAKRESWFVKCDE